MKKGRKRKNSFLEGGGVTQVEKVQERMVKEREEDSGSRVLSKGSQGTFCGKLPSLWRPAGL